MMALRLLFSQILIISVFFLSSCSEEEDSSPTNELLVSFKMNRTNAGPGETIIFTNTSQYGTSYEWDFGDGNSSIEENPTHSYSSIGRFTIYLTANGDEGSVLAANSIIIWDLVLESTFYGDSVKFQGHTDFKAQTVKLIFYNQSSGVAAANLVKHDDGYSHQDMLNTFSNGISYGHHPYWTTEILGVWKEITANKSHIWMGYLEPGLYTLVSVRMDPYGVWYVAGLTVSNE